MKEASPASRAFFGAVFCLGLALGTGDLQAQEANGTAGDQQAEVAKKLQNPVADLVSVPLQNNWDFGIGPEDAMRYTLNFQPVIPFSLNAHWKLTTRTIMPVIYAESPVPGGDSETGLGDILQSFFFVPKELAAGWIVGAGPVLSYPSATDRALGSEKWGVGPTAVLFLQRGGWTTGLLANHVWSFAGTDSRPDVNATFLQPILSYTTKTHTTLGLNTESTYDWENSRWTVPVNMLVSQLLKVGRLPVSLGIGGRYYPEKPENPIEGPEWGLRLVVTLVFPK
ncbi:MAG: transporter [bacterium]